MNRPDVAKRVQSSRPIVSHGVRLASCTRPDRGSTGEPGIDIFAFDIVRTLIGFYACLVGHGDEITFPNARADYS